MAGEVAESTPRAAVLLIFQADDGEGRGARSLLINQDLGNCLLSSYFWQTHNNRLKTNDFVHPG